MLAVVTGDTVGVRGDRTVRGVSAGPYRRQENRYPPAQSLDARVTVSADTGGNHRSCRDLSLDTPARS
jgi:hypothetical protein